MSNRRDCLIKHQILRSCTAVNIDYVFFTQYNTEKYFLEAANENIASPDLRPQYKDRWYNKIWHQSDSEVPNKHLNPFTTKISLVILLLSAIPILWSYFRDFGNESTNIPSIDIFFILITFLFNIVLTL